MQSSTETPVAGMYGVAYHRKFKTKRQTLTARIALLLRPTPVILFLELNTIDTSQDTLIL